MTYGKMHWDEEDFRRAGIPMVRKMVCRDSGGRAWRKTVGVDPEWVIFPTTETVKKSPRKNARRHRHIDGQLYVECTKCHVEKHADEFGKSKKSALGRQSYCKACRQKTVRASRLRTKLSRGRG